LLFSTRDWRSPDGASGAVTRCRSDLAMEAEGEGPQALRSRPSAALTADILNRFEYFMDGYLQRSSEFLCLRRIVNGFVPESKRQNKAM